MADLRPINVAYVKKEVAYCGAFFSQFVTYGGVTWKVILCPCVDHN